MVVVAVEIGDGTGRLVEDGADELQVSASLRERAGVVHRVKGKIHQVSGDGEEVGPVRGDLVEGQPQ